MMSRLDVLSQRLRLWGVAVMMVGTWAVVSRAAVNETVAVDQAANYAASGWVDGSGVGAGWNGGWSLSGVASKSGCFLGTASGNTRLRLGKYAFGLWADSDQLAEAVRRFAAPMAAGDVFCIRWQNLNVSSTYGQSIGVALRDASGSPVIQFFCNGGQGYYRVGDDSPSRLTALAATDQPIDIKIHLISATQYRLTTKGLVVEGTYASPPTQVRVWNWSGRGGGDNDIFFDQPMVVRTATPGVSTVLPEVPQECDEVVVYYDAAGGPLAHAEHPALYIGRNGWMNPRDIPMEPLGDGLWQATYSLRHLTRTLEWVFHDGAAEDRRVWDNNRMQDWTVQIKPCNQAGRVVIDTPLIGQKIPNMTSDISISGRSEGLDGSLYWENETTGQAGWVPVSSNWVVEDLVLAEGTNIFRISGLTTAESPNHGANDSASNATYQNDGWFWRQNAGRGWGEWSLMTNGSSGYFIAKTSTNLVIGPPAWGLYSSDGGRVTAVRRFDSPLRVGEVVRMKFQNNSVGPDASVGISFRDGRDERLLSFLFVGGNANYSISDDVSLRDTGIPWKNTRLDVSFQLTSPTTYRFTVNENTFTGRLNPTDDGEVRIFRFWSENAGSGTKYNVYLTDLAIEGAEMPQRGVTARQVIVRQPGPVVQSGVLGADGRMSLLVGDADPEYAYDLFWTSDLRNQQSWESAQLEQWTPDSESLDFDWTTPPGAASFAFVGGKPFRTWSISNPYASVDWAEFEQHKAAIHMHTFYSDGGGEPGEVIDGYVALGYSIIAITDHDTMGRYASSSDSHRARTTWPWEAFGRVHEALGVMAVEGNEISKLSHHNSFFNSYGNPNIQSESESIEAIASLGGLVFMNHPGKYITNQEPPVRTVEWYIDIFRNYPHVVGMEAYNQGNRYAEDRRIWDAILTEIIAERPVWGFSNDDRHNNGHMGRNGNIMLMSETTEFWMRKVMKEGMFFYFYSPRVNHAALPKIKSIHVNEATGTITIDASNHQRIEWISEGHLVHTGDSITLDNVDNLGAYVRAILYGEIEENILGTQPFYIQRQPTTP